MKNKVTRYCLVCNREFYNGKCWFNHSKEKIKQRAIEYLESMIYQTNINYDERKRLNKLSNRYNYPYKFVAYKAAVLKDEKEINKN